MLGATGRTESESYQEYQASRPTRSVYDSMWAYSNQEHEYYQSLPRVSPNAVLPCGPSGHDTFAYDAALPLTPQQYSPFSPAAFPNSQRPSQYFPSHQLDMRPFAFPPFYGITEPQMMISPGVDYTMPQSMPHCMDYDVTGLAYSPDLITPTCTSPSPSFMSSPEQFCPRSVWPSSVPMSSTEGKVGHGRSIIDEEDVGPFEKPYAQLIYEALLHAPGHRMLLRDIYEWFIRNTRKGRGSGTNGWQNSIRHNLSMNQAFENDKNDPAASRGARKANSVWVLTDHAVKHGVQSTTRFRKNNSSKKGAGNRAPAVQRQRSGARGGRAARRAAQLRRSEEELARSETSVPESCSGFSFGFNDRSTWRCHDERSNCDTYSPATPEGDQFLNLSYRLPHRPRYEVGELAEVKYEVDTFLNEEDRLRVMLSQANSDDALGDLSGF